MTSMTGADFANLVSFEQTLWQGSKLDFRAAKFSDDVSFLSAQLLSDHTSFARTEFLGPEAEFGYAHFDSDSTSFRYAKFASEKTLFEHADFGSGVIEFDGARFLGKDVSFVGASFEGMNKTSFTDASLASACSIDFRAIKRPSWAGKTGVAEIVGPWQGTWPPDHWPDGDSDVDDLSYPARGKDRVAMGSHNFDGALVVAEVLLAVVVGPEVGAGVDTLISPLAVGFDSVVSSAEGGEVVGVGRPVFIERPNVVVVCLCCWAVAVGKDAGQVSMVDLVLEAVGDLVLTDGDGVVEVDHGGDGEVGVGAATPVPDVVEEWITAVAFGPGNGVLAGERVGGEVHEEVDVFALGDPAERRRRHRPGGRQQPGGRRGSR